MKGKFRYILLILILASGAYFALNASKTFPQLQPGAYVGTISGLPLGVEGQSTATFFVERASKSNTLLVVIFSEGFTPEVLAQDSELPLQITQGEETFSIYGKVDGKVLRGKIKSGNGTSGKWQLEPVSYNYLYKGASAQELQSLGSMLALKRDAYVLEKKIAWAKSETETLFKRREELSSALENEEEFQTLAEQKTLALAEVLASKEKEKELLSEEVGTLVSELELLGRISKRGKVTSLARRVSTRENQWYLANWKAQEDLSGMEEFLGNSFNVDLQKLDSQYRRASEIRTMLRQINEEKERIAQLKAALGEAPPGSSGSSSDGTIWNRIFR